MEENLIEEFKILGKEDKIRTNTIEINPQELPNFQKKSQI